MVDIWKQEYDWILNVGYPEWIKVKRDNINRNDIIESKYLTFNWNKCFSGISFRYVNSLEDINKIDINVSDNNGLYHRFNEYDLIDDFLYNYVSVDLVMYENIDISLIYYELDNILIRPNQKILLLNQLNITENGFYKINKNYKLDYEIYNLDNLIVYCKYGTYFDGIFHLIPTLSSTTIYDITYQKNLITELSTFSSDSFSNVFIVTLSSITAEDYPTTLNLKTITSSYIGDNEFGDNYIINIEYKILNSTLIPIPNSSNTAPYYIEVRDSVNSPITSEFTYIENYSYVDSGNMNSGISSHLITSDSSDSNIRIILNMLPNYTNGISCEFEIIVKKIKFINNYEFSYDNFKFNSGGTYILKHIMDYNLNNSNSSLLFSDLDIARKQITTNYSLYSGFTFSGNTANDITPFSIQYKDFIYNIQVDDLKSKLYKNDLCNNQLNIITNSSGTYINLDSGIGKNLDDYINIKIKTYSGTTVYLAKSYIDFDTFIKEIDGNIIKISETIPNEILNSLINKYTGTTYAFYEIRNYNYSENDIYNFSSMINNSYFNKFIESDIIYNTNLSSTTSNYVDSLYNSDDSPFLTFNSINNVWTGYTETSSKFYSNQLISKDDYSYLLNCDISLGNYKFYIIDEYGTKISNEVSVGVGTSQNNLTINSSNSNYSYLIGEVVSSVDSIIDFLKPVFQVPKKLNDTDRFYEPLSGSNLNVSSIIYTPHFVKLIKIRGYDDRLSLLFAYNEDNPGPVHLAIYTSYDGGKTWNFISENVISEIFSIGRGNILGDDEGVEIIEMFTYNQNTFIHIEDLMNGPFTYDFVQSSIPPLIVPYYRPYFMKNQILYASNRYEGLPYGVATYVYSGFGVEYFTSYVNEYGNTPIYLDVVGDLHKITPSYYSPSIDEIIIVGMSLTGRSMILKYSGGIYTTNIDSSISNERYDKISYINKNLSYVIKSNKFYSYDYETNNINLISTINLISSGKTFYIDSDSTKDMKFFNNSDGYILKDKLIKTTNGGVSWVELLTIDSSMTNFQIYNNDIILYAKVSNILYSDFKQYEKIIYTKNGGNTWKNIDLTNLNVTSFQVEYLDYDSNLTDYLILFDDFDSNMNRNIYYLELDSLDVSDFVGNLELSRIHYDYDLNINTKYNENDKYFDYDGINFYYSGINYQFETDNKYIKYKLQPFLYDVWIGFTNDFILYDDFILTGYTYDIDNLTETIKIFPTNVEDLNHFKKYTFLNFTITNSNDYSLILDITDEYLLINIPKNNTNDIITFNSAFTYNISNNNIQNVYKLGEISNILYDIYTNWNDDLEFNDHYYYQIRCDRTKKKIYNSYGEILNSDFLIRKYCTGLIYCDENGKPIYKIYNENDNNLTYDLTELVFIGKDKKSRFPIRLKNDNIINE